MFFALAGVKSISDVSRVECAGHTLRFGRDSTTYINPYLNNQNCQSDKFSQVTYGDSNVALHHGI